MSAGTSRTREREGSAQVEASFLINSMQPSFVSGIAIGSGESKKPSRTGQETTTWQVYLPLLFASPAALPGASSTCVVSQRRTRGRRLRHGNNSLLKKT